MSVRVNVAQDTKDIDGHTNGMYALALRCQGVVKHVISCTGDCQNMVVLVDAELPHINLWILPGLVMYGSEDSIVLADEMAPSRAYPAVNVSPELFVNLLLQIWYPPCLSPSARAALGTFACLLCEAGSGMDSKALRRHRWSARASSVIFRSRSALRGGRECCLFSR